MAPAPPSNPSLDDLAGYAVALRTLAADWTEVANNIARSAQAIDDMVIGVHATWYGRAYDSLHAYWAMYGPQGGLNFQLRQLERTIRELAARLDQAARDLQVQVDHIVDDQNAANLRQALFMSGLTALNIAAVLLTVPTGGFSDVAAEVADEAFLGTEVVAGMGSGSGIGGLVGGLASEFRGLDSGMRGIFWTDVNAVVTADLNGDPLHWSVGDDTLIAGGGLAMAARLPGAVAQLSGRLRTAVEATAVGRYIGARAAPFAVNHPHWESFLRLVFTNAPMTFGYEALWKLLAAQGLLGPEERQPFAWDRRDTIQVVTGTLIAGTVNSVVAGRPAGGLTHSLLVPGSVRGVIRPDGTLGGRLDRLAFKYGGFLEQSAINFVGSGSAVVFYEVAIQGHTPNWATVAEFGLYCASFGVIGGVRTAITTRWGITAPNAHGEQIVVGPPFLRWWADQANYRVISSSVFNGLNLTVPAIRHLNPYFHIPDHPWAPVAAPLATVPEIPPGTQPAPVSAAPPILPTPRIHRVAPGDTLAAILNQEWGHATPDDIRGIAALDHIPDPGHLDVDRLLVIPVL